MQFERLGKTQDDAIGEAYDKVARMLDLGYPGGPKLDALAKTGTARFTMPKTQLDGYDFSYSGLKSHVINVVHNKVQRAESYDPKDLAASFQNAAMEQIFEQTKKAIDAYQPKRLIVAVGVAANNYFRAHMHDKWDLPVDIPAFAYCTDNAAMIGIAAYYQWQTSPASWAFNFNGHARMDFLTEAYNKGKEVIG
jgi:N6-L-threonylcarbamoyladenine synthase